MKIRLGAFVWFLGDLAVGTSFDGRRALSLREFSDIHSSEAHLHFSGEKGGGLREGDNQVLRNWYAALDHEWERALENEKESRRQLGGISEQLKESPTSADGKSPFMVCDEKEGKAGIDAFRGVFNFFQQPEDMIISINQDSRTCFVMMIPPSLAQAANNALNTLVVTPLMAVMKMEGGLLDALNAGEESPYGLSGVLCQPHSQDGGFDLLERILSAPWSKSGRSLLREESAFHPSSRDLWRRHLETSSPESCYEIFEAMTPQTSQDGHHFSFLLPMRMSDSQKKRGCLQTLAAMASSSASICRVGALVPHRTLNEDARWISQSDIEDFTPFFDVGINGTGQIAQISDSGLDQGHCSFVDEENGFVSPRPFFHVERNQRKVVQYISYRDGADYDRGHGTHVTGSAVGYQSGGGVADGAAPGARVAFFDAGDVDDERLIFTPFDLIGDLHALGYDAGARVHSASWGSAGSNLDSQTAMHDQFMYEHDDYLFITSAGNSGSGLATIGSPATTKNGVAVGAAGSNFDRTEVVSFSSRGPTRDGRIKPEVVATGRFVVSAAANIGDRCQTMELSGTSMATPITSGTAMQIRQYFQEGYYPGGYKGSSSLHSNPSGALVKAVLMIGAREMLTAEDISSSNPSSHYDNIQGWGSIFLLNSLPLAGYNSFKSRAHDRVSISQGAHHSYWVKIDTNGGACGQDLRVMMVYTDTPNTMGCATDCVLNDVDMYVFGPNSPVFPNGKTTRDTKHVAERVIVENPVEGELYEIKVEGRDLVSAVQNYALVINGCLAPDEEVLPGTSYPTQAPVTLAPSVADYSISTDKSIYAVGEHIAIEYQQNGPLLDPEDFVGISFEDFGTLEAVKMFRFTCGSSSDTCTNESITTREFDLFGDGEWPLPPGTYYVTLNGQALVDVIYARTVITIVDDRESTNSPTPSGSPSLWPSKSPTITPKPTTTTVPSTDDPTSTAHPTGTAEPTMSNVVPTLRPTCTTEASVGTDGTVYSHGENLNVMFEVDPPLIGDWVGIFPAEAEFSGRSLSNLMREDAWLWAHTCGTQDDCSSMEPMSGVLQFGPEGQSDWPLPAGDYVALLLRDDNTKITSSSLFSVLEDSTICDDNDATFVVRRRTRDCYWLREEYAKRVLRRDYCEQEDALSACPYTCGACLLHCQDDPDYTFEKDGRSYTCERIWEHPGHTKAFCGGEYDPSGENTVRCPRACMACTAGA